MHPGQVKDNTSPNHADLLYVIVVLGSSYDFFRFLWGSGFPEYLTSGVIRLMVGKSYPAPRKFGA